MVKVNPLDASLPECGMRRKDEFGTFYCGSERVKYIKGRTCWTVLMQDQCPYGKKLSLPKEG